MATSVEGDQPAGHPVAIVAVLGFAGMCTSFVQTLLIPIQPLLPELLDAPPSTTAWVITITLLTGAVFNPITGRLGDMYGKKPMALAVLSATVLGSLLCAVTTGVVWLIVGRALQGIGMGIIPLGISMLRDYLAPERVGSAVALVSATLGVGGALGLPLGAVVTEIWDWRLLFWMMAVVGSLAIASVWFILPASARGTGGRFDVVGALGLAAGLSAILIAISRGNSWGWSAPITLGLFAGGAVILVAWGIFEVRLREPLVDLRVSASAPVLLTNLASIAMGFALFSQSIVFPQLLTMPTSIGGMGMALIPASLVLMPSGLTMLAMSPVAGWGERRYGPKPLLVAGAVTLAGVYSAAALLPHTAWGILLINVVLGVGIGLGFAAMPSLIMSFVPRSETAAANGLNTLMRSLGTSTASALIAAVLAQSAIEVDGEALPSQAGFTQALLLGTAAAVACAVLAIAIPARGSRAKAPEHRGDG